MKRIAASLLAFTAFVHAISVSAEQMSIEMVLQNVVDHYPSLKTAAIQVERAKQSTTSVNSQLGWQITAQGGITRDVTLFGTPTDRIDVGGSLSRTLESGSSISLEAGARRDDSEGVFSPVIPNPSTTTNVDLNYRQPLGQGSDNPAYTEGLASAKAELAATEAETKKLYDQVASQVVDLAIAISTVKARIENQQRALKRSQRLGTYIKNRTDLGISEEKDVLQVNAQLNSIKAELKALETSYKKQQVSLNRLMGKPWSNELDIRLPVNNNISDKGFENLLNSAQQHNPEIRSADARIALADSAIRQRRDAREDNLDLVLFIGNRTLSGDTVTGDSSESEIVGGVRLEFQQSVDKSGVDAKLYQAQLDRSAALQDKRQLIEDLEYEISSLLAEIDANREAIKAYENSVASEKKKLADATKRYRTGRTDTDQLIQFEDQLSQAEFALELQQLELVQRQYALKLIEGTLWEAINIPEYQDFDVQGDQ